MATHDLKTWPEHFQKVKKGLKKVELRKNDRDFQIGDGLNLEEWDPETEKYTGDKKYMIVSHILHGGQFGLEKGYVVMSIY